MTREEAITVLTKDMMATEELLNSLPPRARGKSSLNDKVESLKFAISALSQPERSKGRWEGWHTDKFVGYDEYGLEIYRHCHYYSCRKCGRRTAVKTNYCPDCGAEMVRGEEE